MFINDPLADRLAGRWDGEWVSEASGNSGRLRAIISPVDEKTYHVDYDATFLTPWAALYERSHTLLPEVVRTYDRAWWQLRLEVRQVREKVLELHDQLEKGSGPVAEENLRLREELLLTRDDIVGHEARLGEALGRIEVLEAELRRHQDALAGAERILGSHTGRLLRAWHRVRALLR